MRWDSIVRDPTGVNAETQPSQPWLKHSISTVTKREALVIAVTKVLFIATTCSLAVFRISMRVCCRAYINMHRGLPGVVVGTVRSCIVHLGEREIVSLVNIFDNPFKRLETVSIVIKITRPNISQRTALCVGSITPWVIQIPSCVFFAREMVISETMISEFKYIQ